jgi:hypothetical protein
VYGAVVHSGIAMSRMRDYSLSITLGALWLANWALYAVSLRSRPEGFDWQSFWEGTFENNSSEFLQLLSFVVLTSFLIHRGSHESKDGSDRLEGKIDNLIVAIDLLNERTDSMRRRLP